KGFMHNGLDSAGLQQWPHMALKRLSNVALEIDRAWTQGRTGYRQAAAQDLPAINGRLGAPQYGNDDDTAVVCQTFQIAINVIRRDHIQNDVHAFFVRSALDFLDKVLCA